MIDLTTTNILLGILAAVAVLQGVAMIYAAVAVSGAYRRIMDRADHLERTIAPMADRARIVLDRLDRVSERVDHGTEKLDSALAVTARGAEVALQAVGGNVRRTATLVSALATGGRAAVRAWRDYVAPAPARPVRSFPAPVNPNLQQMEESHASIRGRS